MKKYSQLRRSAAAASFLLLFSLCLTTFSSCSGNSSGKEQEETKVDDTEFYSTQPVHSGLYNADYYDITGSNARRGRFDGRIYFSLSPETSAFQVFENGNRTKIDYTIILQKPFEKGDSGVYYSVDNKNRPVTVNTDSTTYFLNFQRSNEDVTIGFSPKARHEGSAVEILEKMTERNKK